MRRALLLVTLLLTVLLAWMNVAVHTAPAPGSSEERERSMEHLAFLEGKVHDGLDDDMQRLFPEGSVFTDALYGLAWCGIARKGTPGKLRSKALQEAGWAYAQLDRADVKARFPALAEPRYGMFYAGWKCLLLGERMSLEGAHADPASREEWDQRAQEIATAFGASQSPFLESYAGMAWPADAVVAMAALALHERSSGPTEHGRIIARWVAQVRSRLDERGMIPHAWDPWADRSAGSARGSSQALMNCFLPMIDRELAFEQFALFREHFLATRLGLTIVREHPHGDHGRGDVDSGPVILGGGSAASLVGAGACRANGDLSVAVGLDATREGLGLVIGGDRKRYLFGLLPMADLFIVWSRTLAPEDAPEALPPPSLLGFHGWSLSILAILWSPWIVRGMRRHRRQRDQYFGV